MSKRIILSQEQVVATLAAWNQQRQQVSDEEQFNISPPFKDTLIGPLNFRRHTFNEPIDFQGAIFAGEVHFYGIRFLQGVNFNFAQFSENVGFTESKFSTWRTSFVNVVFNKAATFSTTTFLDSVSFGGTRFLGSSTFDTTKFTQGVVFSGAAFVETAYFDQVEFDGISYFKGTECREESTFYYAQFRGRTYFKETRFHKKVNFQLSVFEGQVYFIGDNLGSTVFMPTTEVLFHQAVLKDGVLFFENTDLSCCSFWGINPQRFRFLGVRWPKNRSRKSIYDERLCCDIQRKEEERPTYAVVETLYRQLRKNYEERGDYGEVGDFYYGEMEMKRQ